MWSSVKDECCEEMILYEDIFWYMISLQKPVLSLRLRLVNKRCEERLSPNVIINAEILL